MPWTVEEKTFAVEAYIEQKSIVAVQAQFKRHYRCRQAPRHKCIHAWVQMFRTHGTVLKLNAKSQRETHSG